MSWSHICHAQQHTQASCWRFACLFNLCWFAEALVSPGLCPRAIRKLVTNNKRRHSLILALHAAGDGTGYGDLGKVHAAVKNMHNGLAAGTGWTSEAGVCLCSAPGSGL
jgi:hypothetical protein